VALACRASASIPFVYTPIKYKNTIAVDGGVVNNLACDRLKVDDIPWLGVQLVSNDLPLRLNSRQTFGTLTARLIDLMLSACESAHVTAAPEGRCQYGVRQDRPRQLLGSEYTAEDMAITFQ